MTVDFCLPVFNEELILEGSTLRVIEYFTKLQPSYDWRIVLAVNGSNDRSSVIASDLAKSYPERISVLETPSAGKGQALKNCWLQSQADIVAFMDVDLAVSLDNIPGLVDPIVNGRYDLVIGSRLLADSKIDRSIAREFVSQSCHLTSRLILGHKFSDLHCGFKAIKRESFLQIAPKLLDPGWFFDTELAVFARLAGLRIKEIPVDWSEERYDRRKSKVRVFRESLKFMKNYLRLRHRLSLEK